MSNREITWDWSAFLNFGGGERGITDQMGVKLLSAKKSLAAGTAQICRHPLKKGMTEKGNAPS